MIEVVKNNPFRILGLYATASDKEITKRVTELEVYIKMGKSKKYGLDLPFLGNFKRNSETLQDAINKLNKPLEKIFYSLFWFDNIDGFEFKQLTEEKIDEAITLIKNSFDNEKVENINQFSGYKNLSILYLYLIYNDDKNKEENFYKYFYAFSKFLTSDQLNFYIKSLQNKNKIDNNLVIKRYLDVIRNIIKKYLCIDLHSNRSFIDRFINSLFYYPDEIKKYVKDKYIKEALSFVRKEIKKCEQIRKDNPEEAYESGTNLYFNTREYLEFLKSEFNLSDIRYQTIADKLAEEILQCSIVYYNRYYNSDNIDPGEESLELSEFANSIAVGERLKEKIRKDLEITKTWIAGKQEREKQKNIEYHIDSINKQIENLPDFESMELSDDLINYPNIVDNFIFKCKKHLSELKDKIGVFDTLYWNMSNSVVDNAMNIIIVYANHRQDKSPIIYLLDDIAKIDMSGETKNRFLKNAETIINDYRLHLESLKKLEDIELKKRKIRYYSILSLVLVIIIIFILFTSKNNEQQNISKSAKNESESIYKEKHSNRKTSEQPKIELITPNVYKPKEFVKISKYKGNQLKNGASPYNSYFGYGIYDKNCHNEITFKNGNSSDAIVCLVNYYTGKTIRNEYIRKNTNFKMTNIPNGIYYIKVFSGNDWNPEKVIVNGKIKGGFETNVGFSISNDYSDLLKLNDDGYKYTIGSITLYQVPYGNMKSEAINEKDFFK